MPDPTSLHHCLKNKQLKLNAFGGKDPAKGLFKIKHTKEGCGYPYRNDKVVTTLAQGCHNLGTRLSQPWHKVVTTLPQCFFTTLAQPWHNLGTTLYFETVARL